MNSDEILSSFTSLNIPKTHATVGLSNLIASNKQYRQLFVNRRMPENGWSDVQIQLLLYTLSTLDTNNKQQLDNQETSSRWCGVGEREGRVYSTLVSQRHFGLSHGMGRSGDITEPQPKAVGSSVLVQLTLLLALDAVRASGLSPQTIARHGILLPLCTGMSMSLVLSSLREHANSNKRIVLWSRIDQKSCFKAIQSAGLQCVVVPTTRRGDAVVTDLDALQALLTRHEGKVLAVLTCTSCFAPRIPDRVDEVAKLCATHDVHHIINHAYGLQCHATNKLLNRASVVGRVDAVVCSTDKNFLVPVGGAIVLSRNKSVIENIGKVYAGRASSSPIVDLFITLLSMGMRGYKRLLAQRSDMLETFSARLEAVAARFGERLLITYPSNTISFGITLDQLARPRRDDEEEEEYLEAVSKDISSFGSMLFSRCVSGTRVVPRGGSKIIGGHEFVGFGSSVDDYPHAYMTAACALGVSRDEVDEFFVRLDKTFKEFKKKNTSTNQNK